MYGLPINYNPFGPHAPAHKPGDSQTDVPLAQFKAAQAVYATHLSADGQRVYTERADGVRVFFWDGGSKTFGSSFPCDGLPGEVVKLPES